MIGVGVGLRRRRFGGGGGGFDSDYQAVLDYATTQSYTLPSSAQQTLQNQLVVDLKSAGIWSKLDSFAVFATDGDSDFALIDWIRLTDYTAVNSPTFTTNQGFQGDGVSAYIDTNWNPFTDGVNYTQDDASYGGYRFNNINDFSRFLGNDNNMYIREDTTNRHYINASVGASSNLTGNGIGLRVLNRTNSNDIQMIVDNTVETSTQSSTVVANSNLLLLQRGTGQNFSLSEIGLALAGANLVTERTDLYDAVNTYITSL